MSSPRNPTGRRIPRLGEDVCARIRKQCSASQPAGDTSKPDEISIPTATGQEFFVFKGSDGMVRENLVCDQVVPKKKKHRHLNIKPNPSGEKISYGQLERCGLLGKGSQGEVQLVKFRGRPYALKRLAAIGGLVGGCKKSMQRELEKVILELTQLHRYAVESYDAYWSESDAKLCILMEYMRHGSLLDVLASLRNPVLPSSCYPAEAEHLASGSSSSTTNTESNTTVFCSEDVSFIARSILKGLVELQRLGLVHNDIKPANILVTRKGAVKIADFGVARWTNTVSFAGSGAGTQCYMAPEKLLGSSYSYQADVYSFGLTIAFCATGSFPASIAGLSPFELISTMVKGIVLDPTPPLPPTLHDLISQSLCMKWEARPQAKQLLSHPFFETCPPSKPPHFLKAIAKEEEDTE